VKGGWKDWQGLRRRDFKSSKKEKRREEQCSFKPKGSNKIKAEI